MDLKRVHFLREVLVTDARGKTDSTMQYSFDNASYLQPAFLEVPFDWQARARQLYSERGGTRDEKGRVGTIVILP